MDKQSFICVLLISVSVMSGLCCQSKNKTKQADGEVSSGQKSSEKISYFTANEGNTITRRLISQKKT